MKDVTEWFGHDVATALEHYHQVMMGIDIEKLLVENQNFDSRKDRQKSEVRSCSPSSFTTGCQQASEGHLETSEQPMTQPAR